MDFSSLKGFELGKLLLSSGLLQSSWNKISQLHASALLNPQPPGLGIRIFQETNYTLVVFVPPPICKTSPLNFDSTLLYGSKDQNPFHFLCSEKISSFSLHTPTLELFLSGYKRNLLDLKSELIHLLEANKPVIITGAALGGSVASLFTLWLLETIEPTLKRPLCITFGSPLIGDAKLQQILENSLRNSCFLHVAEASRTPINTDFFKPFGTFLICFESECICIDDPEAVMELLGGANEDVGAWIDYGGVLKRLDQAVMEDSRLMIDDVIKGCDEKKKLRFDPLKKLNDMKISMIYIEWYKKKSKMSKIGYYDRFKTRITPFDVDIEKRKLELNDYWRSLVEEVEKKPQSEKSVLKTRSLFSGNNYRRMVEPLDIAEYYSSGRREYKATGRSRHYIMLEKWFKEKEKIEQKRCEKRDLSDLLMFDSCFWSEVEEALIVMSDLKRQDGEREVLVRKLVRFEEYVWGMISKREVSPEIFLEKSSFMKWWNEYKEIKGLHASPSELAKFMNGRMYERYGQAC